MPIWSFSVGFARNQKPNVGFKLNQSLYFPEKCKNVARRYNFETIPKTNFVVAWLADLLYRIQSVQSIVCSKYHDTESLKHFWSVQK